MNIEGEALPTWSRRLYCLMYFLYISNKDGIFPLVLIEIVNAEDRTYFREVYEFTSMYCEQ
jgi:hypothetical protein